MVESQFEANSKLNSQFGSSQIGFVRTVPELIPVFLAFVITGMLVTMSFLGNFASTQLFLGWVGSFDLLSWTGLADRFKAPVVSPDLAYLSLTFAPGFIVALFITEWSITGYLATKSDSIDVQVRRGFSRQKIFFPHLTKLSVTSIIASVTGFAIAKILLNERLSYVSDLFVNDSRLSRYYQFSLYEDFINFGITVLIVSLLFLVLGLRHLIKRLVLTQQRIDPSLNEPEKSFLPQLLLHLGIVVVSVFFILELVRLGIAVEHPVIVATTIISLLLVFYSTDKLVILLLQRVFGNKTFELRTRPEHSLTVAHYGYRYFGTLIVRVFAPLTYLAFVCFFLDESNLLLLRDLTSMFSVCIVITILLFYLHPQSKVLRLVHRVMWLKRQNNSSKYVFTFFALLFALLVWQQATYVTISQNALDDVHFQNYGADLRIGPNIGKMNVFGIGENEEDVIKQTAPDKITSVLRYYINQKHSIVPKTEENVHFIMFDPEKYLEGNYLLRDEWFIGGTASDLLETLSVNATIDHAQNGTASIILDTNLASQFSKKIGDQLVVRPHYDHLDMRGTTGVEYRFTIIGLVNYFPAGEAREFSTDNPEYKPFGLLPINLATADFQNPPFNNIHKSDLRLTSYFLVNTISAADPEVVLSEVLEADNAGSQIYDLRNSRTIVPLVQNSDFVKRTFRYQQITGVMQLLYFLIVTVFGIRLIMDWRKRELSSEENTLLCRIGVEEGVGGLAALLNRVVVLAFASTIGLFVGVLFTEALSQLLLPSTSLPVKLFINQPLPLLLSFGILVCFSVVLYLGQSLKISSQAAMPHFVELGIAVVFITSPFSAYAVEKTFVTDLKFASYTEYFVLIAIVILAALSLFRVMVFLKSQKDSSGFTSDALLGDQAMSLGLSLATVLAAVSLGIILFPQDLVVDMTLVWIALMMELLLAELGLAMLILRRRKQKPMLMSLLGLIPIFLIAFIILGLLSTPNALFLASLWLALLCFQGLLGYFGLRLRLPRLTMSSWSFYALILKKFAQNRQRLVVMVSGLILALALIAGVSTHVDTVSQNVVRDYFESTERVSDLFIDAGDRSADSLSKFADESLSTYSWIKEAGIMLRWHVHYFSTLPTPEWEKESFINPTETGFGVRVPGFVTSSKLIPIITVYPNFLEMHGDELILEQGNLTLSSNEVVVTGRFGAEFLSTNDYIGRSFRLFDWMTSTKMVFPPSYNPYPQANTNWTSPHLTITGGVSENSPLFEYLFSLGSNYPGIKHIKTFGAVIMLATEETMPSFWEELKYQPGRIECPECPSFESFATLRVDHTQIDQINPASFMEKIKNFESSLESYYSPHNQYVRFEAPIGEVLTKYVEWSTTTRASLILLSAPIIFLGWFVADFTFSQVYKERRKEISSLKSRGVSNSQITTMLALEAFFLVIVATVTGLVLGVASNYVLEFLRQQDPESVSVFQQLLSVGGALATNRPLVETDVVMFVSPLTIGVTLLAGLFLLFLGSFRPIREVINWPIDEILQTEHAGKLTETAQEVNFRTIRSYLGVGVIGVIFLLSLATLDPAYLSSNLVVVLAILGMGVMFVGLINGMAHVARLVPAFFELLTTFSGRKRFFLDVLYISFVLATPLVILLTEVGSELMSPRSAFSIEFVLIIYALLVISPFIVSSMTKLAQWYVTAREMSRHAKTTVAAFVVISLTLAFGIITSTVIVSSADYYYRDATLEVGVEGIRFTTLSGREHSFPEHFDRIQAELENQTGVLSVSPYYKARGWVLSDQRTSDPNWPPLSLFSMLIQWGAVDLADIVFVGDYNTFFDTAYLFDQFFVDDTVEDVRARFNYTYHTYWLDRVYDRYLPVIIDGRSARQYGLGINDTYYFTAARIDVFKGVGRIVGIAETMPPGLNSPFVVAPHFGNNVWKYFSIGNPTSGYLVKTTNATTAEQVKNNVLSDLSEHQASSVFYGIQSGMIADDYLKQADVALELSTLVQIMNLDFLYSLILAGLGFMLIIGFRTAQKAHEIGTLKAVGMSNNGVISLIFLEALIIIFVAVLTGSLIGYIGGSSLTLLLPQLRVEKVVIFPQELIVPQIILGAVFAALGSLLASKTANRYKISHLIR